MTTATELVSAPSATPPYDIVRAAYAELRVTDLAASERFYVDLLGMVVAERTSDTLYLRGWEERLRHSLVLRQAPVAAAARLGFRVRREEDLDLLAADLDAHGLATEWAHGPEPGVGRALRVWDPFGFPLEFFHQMEQAETQLQRFDLHRGAPILRFGPSQPAHPADRGRLPLLDGSRLPLLGVHLDRRSRRPHHRRVAPTQADRPRRRLDCGPRAAAAPHRVLGR